MTPWHSLTPKQRRDAIGALVDDLADCEHEVEPEDIERDQALIELARMTDAPVPVPPAPPGFTGQRLLTLGTARDVAHVVTLALYGFADGSSEPYVEVREEHDGAGPGQVMALSTLVHLVQNATEEDVWGIGGRAAPGVIEPSDDCDSCGGVGRIRVTAEDGQRRNADGWRKCLDCSGTGKEVATKADLTRRPLPPGGGG